MFNNIEEVETEVANVCDEIAILEEAMKDCEDGRVYQELNQKRNSLDHRLTRAKSALEEFQKNSTLNKVVGAAAGIRDDRDQRLEELGIGLDRIADVMNAGNRVKYQPGDWLENKTFEDHMSSFNRHLTKYMNGELIDDETGRASLDMAATRLVMALCYGERS